MGSLELRVALFLYSWRFSMNAATFRGPALLLASLGYFLGIIYKIVSLYRCAKLFFINKVLADNG